MTLPIYVINLDRRPDRWRSILDNLNRIGLTVHRISAIDGLTLTQQASAKMSTGEEACLLSHCKALKSFLESSHPAALFLEDDARLSRDIYGCLQSTDWWPKNTGLLQLSVSDDRWDIVGSSIGKTPCGRRIYPILRRCSFSTGYLVDRETAQLVLNACTVPPMPIDQLLFFTSKSALARRLKPVLINPAIIQHKDLADSDISLSRDNMDRSAKKEKKTWERRFFRSRVLWLKMIGKTTRIRFHYAA